MLDERIAKDLADRYVTMRDSGELLPKARLDSIYATFRHRFGPEALASLDGEALLSTMHDHSNRDSLVYWLEYKNDEEVPAHFGSIGGGSALKFRLYRRVETGAWMTGSSTRQRELTIDEAIPVARQHRDQLIAGVKELERLPSDTSDRTYAELQIAMDRVAPDVSRLAWGHKYFSLLFPDKLDDYHVESYQRFHLIKLLQTPPEGEGRYLCGGRFISIARHLGMPLNHLTTLLNGRNGDPYRYWRIGTRLGGRDSVWNLMKDGSFVAIGWAQLGDLSDIEYKTESKERIREMLRPEYVDAPGVLGQKTQEIFNFVTVVAESDLVLASDGTQTLGVGRIVGGYQYAQGDPAPHRRPVEWLNLDEWGLPVPEGLRTTVSEIRRAPQNLIEIERRLLAAPAPVLRPAAPHAPLRLEGVPGRVQAILERKRNVILYGPPGTGKTYWAKLAACDLAAHAAFGETFDALGPEQRLAIFSETGFVRLCAFHPAYGYEDFLEGYRPVSTDGKLAFQRRDGVFKRLCDDARRRPDSKYFLIVDEINRGDIPRIFGELLTVLERDKRGQSILLQLSGEPFSVPDNVYVLGTMNTADRSIALLDTALRRRFGFVELMPDSAVLAKTIVEDIPLGLWLDALNQRIRQHIGRDARNLQVGHAYLMEGGRPVADFARFARIVQDDIIPLVQEYCYENFDGLASILGAGLVDRPGQAIRHELFNPGRRKGLVTALLALAPEIATSGQVTDNEDVSPEGAGGEEEDNVGGEEPGGN